MSQGSDVMSIDQAMKLASSSGFVLSDQYGDVLDILENHECWSLWFNVVKAHVKASPAKSLEDYIRMIRVNIFYLEDLDAAASVSKELVHTK